jgi:hypothetical protein
MLAASQDIDYFIERQRSKLNKAPNRQQMNRQQVNRQQVNRQRPAPPPPPPPQYLPPTNMEDRLDFKVNRILDEPSPRGQSQRSYYPPSPPPFTGNSYPDQQVPYYPEQDQRRFSNDDENNNNNQFGFFDRFGSHDEKRAQLKDDLKREYNEYLRSQQRGSKNKSTSQVASSRGNTNRHVRFQQDGKVVAPWEKNGNRKTQNSQSMNDISSSSSTTTTTEYATNRSGSRVSRHDEQYIRDREEYILELYDQISELEARKRHLEMGIYFIFFFNNL